MRRIGKRTLAWIEARERLKEVYKRKGVTQCERCGVGTFALSFHHLDKRSSGKAKHTFGGTRLLCAECHDLVEYDKEENEKLKNLR